VSKRGRWNYGKIAFEGGFGFVRDGFGMGGDAGVWGGAAWGGGVYTERGESCWLARRWDGAISGCDASDFVEQGSEREGLHQQRDCVDDAFAE